MSAEGDKGQFVYLALRVGLTAKERADLELVWGEIAPGTPMCPVALQKFFEGIVRTSLLEFRDVIRTKAARIRDARERSLAA